jgi:hypothetical protein
MLPVTNVDTKKQIVCCFGCRHYVSLPYAAGSGGLLRKTSLLSYLETEVKLCRSHGCLKVTAHEKLEWRDYEI